MLIRIVRMTIKENLVNDFLSIFDQNKHRIRNVEGCSHLELLKDQDATNIYYTISHWKNTEELDNYRNSKVFENVWGRVKPMFSEKTKVYSLKKFLTV